MGIGYRNQGAVCSKRGTTDYRTTDNRTTRRKKDSEQWAASRGISVNPDPKKETVKNELSLS